MIDRLQAIQLKYRDEVFYAMPTLPGRGINPDKRAEKHIVCRVNGKTGLGPDQTFHVPLKIGFNGHADVNETNNQMFHMPGTCPCRECAK